MKKENRKMEKMAINELLNEFIHDKQEKEILIARIFNVVEYISWLHDCASDEWNRRRQNVNVDEYNLVKACQEWLSRCDITNVDPYHVVHASDYFCPELIPLRDRFNSWGDNSMDDLRHKKELIDEKFEKMYEICVRAIRRVRNIVRENGLEEEVGFLRF